MGQHSPPCVSGDLLQTPGSAHGMVPCDLWWTFCHWNNLLQVLLPNEGVLPWSLVTLLLTLSVNASTSQLKKYQIKEIRETILSITQTLNEWTYSQNEGKNWLSRKAARVWATGRMHSLKWVLHQTGCSSQREWNTSPKNWYTPLMILLWHLWYSSVPLQVCN